LVRFPDNIALEFLTDVHQGSDRTTGFRKENGTRKLTMSEAMTSKIGEKIRRAVISPPDAAFPRLLG
jgi:hypothetical protein